MEERFYFNDQERELLFTLYKQLIRLSCDALQKDDCRKLKGYLIDYLNKGDIPRNAFGMNPIIKDMQTAVIVAEEIGMKRASILSIMLHEPVKHGLCTLDFVKEEFGEDVAGIIKGLVKINELYAKSPTVESENFRNLLLSFAEDMRVILIMIADRVNLMRQIKDTTNEEARQQVSNEAAYLYAPLAHKLGLYKLKSELEDLSLKYTEKEMYYHIKEKLNETKASRDRYIAAFIQPIQKKLEDAGLKFHMKGRTKSIHSIYQKMKKQKCPFEGVYDLFAIRIILDSELEKEKQECWHSSIMALKPFCRGRFQSIHISIQPGPRPRPLAAVPPPTRFVPVFFQGASTMPVCTNASRRSSALTARFAPSFIPKGRNS